jgi:hypothetical protein
MSRHRDLSFPAEGKKGWNSISVVAAVGSSSFQPCFFGGCITLLLLSAYLPRARLPPRPHRRATCRSLRSNSSRMNEPFQTTNPGRNDRHLLGPSPLLWTLISRRGHNCLSRIAQSVESWSNKPLVMGSSPSVTTSPLFWTFGLLITPS